jgi:hypothetical protein
MKRILPVGLVAVVSWAAGAAVSDAQVFVRAPFVRVQVGPGVSIRAPFFRFYSPPDGPVYVYPPGFVPPPPFAFAPGPQVAPAVVNASPANSPPLPMPKVSPPAPAPVIESPPTALQGGQVMTLRQFATTFQPKAGAYEVDLINPVTKQPTKVRFTLPDGTPRRVQVRDDELEFRYGPLRFVRIEFDRDGAQVVSR